MTKEKFIAKWCPVNEVNKTSEFVNDLFSLLKATVKDLNNTIIENLEENITKNRNEKI